MSYRQGRDAVDGYVWLDDPDITLSAGPSHARDAREGDPPYEAPKIRMGFAPPPVVEPLTWEGDNA